MGLLIVTSLFQKTKKTRAKHTLMHVCMSISSEVSAIRPYNPIFHHASTFLHLFFLFLLWSPVDYLSNTLDPHFLDPVTSTHCFPLSTSTSSSHDHRLGPVGSHRPMAPESLVLSILLCMTPVFAHPSSCATPTPAWFQLRKTSAPLTLPHFYYLFLPYILTCIHTHFMVLHYNLSFVAHSYFFDTFFLSHLPGKFPIICPCVCTSVAEHRRVEHKSRQSNITTTQQSFYFFLANLLSHSPRRQFHTFSLIKPP